MEEGKLESLLQKAWCKESSSDPEKWSDSNPAYGQCAVSSIVAQDYLGGDIVWCEAVLPSGEKVSHYFNLIDGKEKDFTRSQFPDNTTIPGGVPKTKGFPSTRDYVLSFQKTVERYELLKRQIERILKE
ncbi:Uncharacterised protein [uncultured archaeon]|nr:Uncharacterised protein [uncultured archaeon]